MTTLSHRIHLVVGLIATAMIGAWALEVLLSATPDRPFGHTQMAHIVGWVGFVMIALTFVYPIKRRLHPNQVWPKTWFEIHKSLGIAGPLLILVHSGLHFHAIVPVLALIAMIIVVLSGITGQALHHLAFQTLNKQRHDLATEGLSEEAVESRLHDLAMQEETLRGWLCVHGPFTLTFVVLTLIHIGGALYYGGW